MHFEKLRQQRPRRLRHMRTRAVLDLREIRLADGRCLLALLASPASKLFPNGANDLQLSHRSIQASQRFFNLAEVANFLAQLHIDMLAISQNVIFILQYVIYVKRAICPVIRRLAEAPGISALPSQMIARRRHSSERAVIPKSQTARRLVMPGVATGTRPISPFALN